VFLQLIFVFFLLLHDFLNFLISFLGAIEISKMNYRGVSGFGRFVCPVCRRASFNFHIALNQHVKQCKRSYSSLFSFIKFKEPSFASADFYSHIFIRQ
jgi:hypothetical protein